MAAAATRWAAARRGAAPAAAGGELEEALSAAKHVGATNAALRDALSGEHRSAEGMGAPSRWQMGTAAIGTM